MEVGDTSSLQLLASEALRMSTADRKSRKNPARHHKNMHTMQMYVAARHRLAKCMGYFGLHFDTSLSSGEATHTGSMQSS